MRWTQWPSGPRRYLREKINENQKIPGSPPGLGNLKKVQASVGIRPKNLRLNDNLHYCPFVSLVSLVMDGTTLIDGAI